MTTPGQVPQTTWTVTGQNEQTQVQPGGNPVRGVVVYFTTGAGHTGSVFVPYAQYNADNVGRLVGAAAVNMDQIGALTGGATAG